MPDKKLTNGSEQGVEVPYEQLEPETLERLIEEFVTRDGTNWADQDGALEKKIGQVMAQLRNKKVRVVFDLTSQTTNIIPSARISKRRG
jgi:uncharacterized protein YheU (UPF0270 family)